MNDNHPLPAFPRAPSPASAPRRGQTLLIAALLAVAGLFSASRTLALLAVLSILALWVAARVVSGLERRAPGAGYGLVALVAVMLLGELALTGPDSRLAGVTRGLAELRASLPSVNRAPGLPELLELARAG